MNTRAKGRKFEKREDAVWQECGWETELVRPESRWIGPGKVVAAYRDFFRRYDIIALWPKGKIAVFIQVSTEPPSSHTDPGPFGLPPLTHGGLVPVNVILTAPGGGPFKAFEGVFEVYVRYVRKGRGYEAQRQWWKRE